MPEFVSATVIGLLVVPWVVVGKETLPGINVTAGCGGGGATPVPLSCTACGLPGALSVANKVACCKPLAVGVKMTETVQDLLGAKTVGAPQLSVSVNSPAFDPVIAMAFRLNP